jgi:pimeloyl-ACP methyl ester carboxylesterase
MMAPFVRTSDVEVGHLPLPGILAIPEDPRGLVIFAHGSGSSRFSPRNALAARRHHTANFATLLFDLLTHTESADRRNVFDIPLLAIRMGEAISWKRTERQISKLPVGLFGASTGAAAALAAAAAHPGEVAAVVSRGGRPDLAADALAHVRAPTLLIVGSEDHDVLLLNQEARDRMRCQTDLLIIPGAGHLFEEPGTLDRALTGAVSWFMSHLAGEPR